MMNYTNICCIKCNKTFTMERINIKCDICRALADFQYVFSDYVCETMQLCVSTYVHVQRHLCACMTTLDLKNVLLGVGSYFFLLNSSLHSRAASNPRPPHLAELCQQMILANSLFHRLLACAPLPPCHWRFGS